MSWSFELSFFIFLIIVFASQALAVRLHSLVPMPLIMGIFCIIGFALNIIPKDFVVNSNMTAVGTIAFNVFVIHNATMIDISFLKEHSTDAIACILGSLILTCILALCTKGILGQKLSLLSPGPVLGSGASCAIASYSVKSTHPELSVYPWMIFMFQGLFSVPVVTWALKREAKIILNNYNDSEDETCALNPIENNKRSNLLHINGLCKKVPSAYKTPAYYLGTIMIANIFSKYLYTEFLTPYKLNTNVIALCIGFIFAQLGFLDKAPLNKSDSFGLLLMGLMGLMANTLANTPLDSILSLFGPIIFVFSVSTLVLILCGIAAGRLFGYSSYRGIALMANCMMGFPVNEMLLQNVAKLAESDSEKEYLAKQIFPILNTGTMLIVNTISILIVSIMVNFI
ncbi:hypothetical protein TSYNTROOL_06270 [Tepidanaerobacter syntrophicus]|uniref:hypothetical protein n=1 Tax=Tepidanaerobacter syntrophicus TaxID=224999 RepID=UPI001BD1CC69|nr:hypothetical protein [Tepidanaerobacter syntrophicus]GLI50541.1 hypothetical protein TSYNTROOL_06270 [Tepidanaerobacter syntrophicus]